MRLLKSEIIEPNLQVSGFRPPIDALIALHLLAPARLKTIVEATWSEPGHSGGVTWNLLATVECGLAIVRAQSAEHWVHVDLGAEKRKPRDASVSSYLVPYADVSRIGVDIVIREDARELVYCDATWQVESASHGPIELTEGSAVADDGQGAGDFCRHLQSQVARAATPLSIFPRVDGLND